MADMLTCACGWTVISPLGRQDVKKYTLIHLRDSHPGTSITEDELERMIKTV
jgi:predicted small metal-binding protein